jgi:glycine dehydrogenase subunit 1
LNVQKTQYLKNQLLQLNGWKEVFSAPVYNEFVLRCPNTRQVNEKLKNEGIIGGYELQKDYPQLENTILLCATEMILRDDIDQIVSILK